MDGEITSRKRQLRVPVPVARSTCRKNSFLHSILVYIHFMKTKILHIEKLTQSKVLVVGDGAIILRSKAFVGTEAFFGR